MAKEKLGHAEQVRQLFDTKAPTWSDKYSSGGVLTDRLTQITDALATCVQPESRILDIGCGTGDIALAAASMGMNMTGCDISAEMLRYAAQRDSDGSLRWVQLDVDWHTLPFADATFDAIVATSILEYVTEPRAVLGECARVLRSGGVLMCTVPDLNSPVRWLECTLGISGRMPGAGALARSWPRLGRYLAYLSTSRQRHFPRWWIQVAGSCGLLHLQRDHREMRQAPLRLLLFRRVESALHKGLETGE